MDPQRWFLVVSGPPASGKSTLAPLLAARGGAGEQLLPLRGTNAPTSVAEGADTAVWLATLPDDGPTDGFYYDRQQIPW